MRAAHVLEPTLTGRRFEVLPERQPRKSVAHLVVWTTFAVVALLLMDVLDLTVYGVVIPVAGVLLALVIARIGPSNRSIVWTRLVVDRADVIVIVALYVVTVALFRLAFGVFGTERVAGLFVSFAALLVGVVGSVAYTTWIRRPPARLHRDRGAEPTHHAASGLAPGRGSVLDHAVGL